MAARPHITTVTERRKQRADAAIDRACGGIGRTRDHATVDEILSHCQFTLDELAAIARVTGDVDPAMRLIQTKLRAIGVSVTNDRY